MGSRVILIVAVLVMAPFLVIATHFSTVTFDLTKNEFAYDDSQNLTLKQYDALSELDTNQKRYNTDGRGYSFNYATNAGGSVPPGGVSEAIGLAIAVHTDGCAYVTGDFVGFLSFGGNTTLVSISDYNIFVAKLDYDGSWIWAVQIDGDGSEDGTGGTGISVDSNGDVYVTGNFDGTAIFGSISLTSSGYSDVFVTKLSSGGSWTWAVKAGGEAEELGGGIALDTNGDIYVTGEFGSDPAAFGSTNLASCAFCGSYMAIFVAKLSNNGTWSWAIQGGDDEDLVKNPEITVDYYGGDIFVTGNFWGTATFGDINLTSSGGADIFVGMIGNGGEWWWAVKAGGNSNDFGNGIDIDSAGNPYIIGTFRETSTFGSISITSNGDDDIFVAKLNVGDGSWLWADKAGGTSYDAGIGIDFRINDGIYITGNFRETAIFGNIVLTSNGSSDIFLAKLNDSGSWQWAARAGGASYDSAEAITISINGNAYMTGKFEGTANFGGASVISEYDGFDLFAVALHITDIDSDLHPSGWDNCFSIANENQTNFDGDEDGDVCDDDDDDDGTIDINDDFQFDAGADTDTDGDGMPNTVISNYTGELIEDIDDDNDGLNDENDSCSAGIIDWTSNSTTDHDSDGCQDSSEDGDDDNDGMIDDFDDCNQGNLNWISDAATDYDSDGCQDSSEDNDDDNDGIIDDQDHCPRNMTNWISNITTTDHDSDGCNDIEEDEDDDNDGYNDSVDTFPFDPTEWEDNDEDGTGDNSDAFPNDKTQWSDIDGDGYGDNNSMNATTPDDCPQVNGNSTFDRYGCIDSDGDGMSDEVDDSPFDSNSTSDIDNDGFDDLRVDNCPSIYNPYQEDYDLDGMGDYCDPDDDDDGVIDASDSCLESPMGWTSSPLLDYDGDGCLDGSEDSDDDGDGIEDGVDSCPKGDFGWLTSASTDHDADGCNDNTEDLDDDNDAKDDLRDQCPLGVINWESTIHTDHDADGCKDSEEDEDDDGDGIPDDIDDCPLGLTEWTSDESTDATMDGCMDGKEKADEEIEVGDFMQRLEEGDLDAIGIVLAIALPVIGISISIILRKRKTAAVQSIRRKIRFARSGFRLNDIRSNLIELATKDRLSQTQYDLLMAELERRHTLVVPPAPPPRPDMKAGLPPEPPSPQLWGKLGTDGIEWLEHDGQRWHRVAGSCSEWTKSKP